MRKVVRRPEPWPVTIITARYGGGFFAFNQEPWDVNGDVYGDDITYADWQCDVKENKWLVGRGGDPNKAYEDLVEKLYQYQLACPHENRNDFTKYSYCLQCEARLE